MVFTNDNDSKAHCRCNCRGEYKMKCIDCEFFELGEAGPLIGYCSQYFRTDGLKLLTHENTVKCDKFDIKRPKIAKCLFCGGKAALSHIDRNCHSYFYMSCENNKCCFSGPYRTSKTEAIEVWNGLRYEYE